MPADLRAYRRQAIGIAIAITPLVAGFPKILPKTYVASATLIVNRRVRRRDDFERAFRIPVLSKFDAIEFAPRSA